MDSDKVEGTLKEKEGEITGDEVREKQGKVRRRGARPRKRSTTSRTTTSERPPARGLSCQAPAPSARAEPA